MGRVMNRYCSAAPPVRDLEPPPAGVGLIGRQHLGVTCWVSKVGEPCSELHEQRMTVRRLLLVLLAKPIVTADRLKLAALPR